MKNGNNVLEGVDIKDFEPLFRFAGDSDRHGLSQWYEITFDKSIDPKEIARQVSEDKDVEAVEYNALIEHSCNHESVDYITSPAVKSAAPSQTEDLPFNDPELPKQWHLINTGNQDLVPHSVAGADVGVKDAWRLCTGDNRVIVAVFDVGVMTFHADLKIYLSFETKGNVDTGDFRIYQKTTDEGYDLYCGTWNTEGNILSGSYNDGETWAYSYEFEIYSEPVNTNDIAIYLKLKATEEGGKENMFVACTIPEVIKETSDVVVKGHPADGTPIL